MKIQTCVYIAATVANILHALRASFKLLASVRTHMYALYMFVYCGSVRRDHVHTLNTHSVYVL